MGSNQIGSEAYKRHYALLDVLLILFWTLLTGTLVSLFKGEDISMYGVILGILAASTVTLTAHEFVIQGEKREKESIITYLTDLKNVIALFLDIGARLIVANAVLMYQATTLEVEPRIVKVGVNLTSEAEVTLISLLITLVPGTLVIDADEREDGYHLYVHYSYLKSEDLGSNIKKTIKKWDGQIRGLFK